MTEPEVIEAVWRSFQETVGSPFRLFLFGSRAAGEAGQFSDFDFLVKGDSRVPEEYWFKFRQKVEAINTLFKIDLVDFYPTNDDFKEIASKCLKEVVDGRLRP